MGNFFLGFPVPRAKIADMITGAAPPLEHIANHLPGGSDPLIAPDGMQAGQIIQWDGEKFIAVAPPSAGIATRYADTDIFWATNFESLDGFYNSASLTASVTLSDAMLELNTGTDNNALAYFRKEHTIQLPVGTWHNARKFRVMAQFYSTHNSTGINFIGTGKSYTLRHIGFCVVDGLLKGSVHNGSSQTTVTLEDWGGGSYLETRKLEAVFTPGSKAEFYIAGVKIDEITTGLPSGPTDAEHWICGYVKNTDGANNLTLRLSQFECTQAL
ncbi:hypothetical protein ES702_06295 [subsurface metagenome]